MSRTASNLVVVEDGGLMSIWPTMNGEPASVGAASQIGHQSGHCPVLYCTVRYCGAPRGRGQAGRGGRRTASD